MMMKIQLLVAVAALTVVAACAGAEGPDANAAAPAAAVDRTVDCPALTKAKYPFLRCVRDDAGHVVFDGAPDYIEMSQMPPLDPFVESDDYWGD